MNALYLILGWCLVGLIAAILFGLVAVFGRKGRQD